jgi:HAD superfamily hydrolase (TIGR01490 family)
MQERAGSRPRAGIGMSRLALFDLDHTLLSGDTDVLWCEFLIGEGRLDRATFEPRNRAVAERYAQGLASAAEFAGFYAQTFAGASPPGWHALRARFFAKLIAPRLPASARALVEQHRARGDRLVLTTATSRYLTEPTAADLGIDALIATELEVVDGLFTGRTQGTPNMREGKVERLRAWLGTAGIDPGGLAEATFYSDSANDLPLLSAVGLPVLVDPDPAFEARVAERGWPVLRLAR